MQLVETKISGTMVHMRCADNPDSAKAIQWIDFQVPLALLELPSSQGDHPLGNPESRYLGSIQQAALRYARDLIGAETQALADRVGQRA